MLNNDTYTTYLLAQMEIKNFHSTADRLRMPSLQKKRKAEQHRKAVLSILHGTGKALINTGNRLLEIA